jgi:cobalt-zinc-cadmium efflux system membrane fusion protein
MKSDQLLVIAFICGAGVIAGWNILRTGPPSLKQEQKEEKKGEADEDQNPGLGKVELTKETVERSGIILEEAGPRKLQKTLKLNGRITANEDRMAYVIPRFPGVVKAVRKRLGDKIQEGEVLITVQSNESLQNYDVKSEITGTIIKKEVTLGEFVSESSTIFVIGDLSSVWVDLNVYQEDFSELKPGQRLILYGGPGRERIDSTISYISPLSSQSTQTMLARAVVPNLQGDLRPGLFVSGEIVIGEIDAPVAVRVSAIQTIEEKSVVFVQEGTAFEAREVDRGEQAGEWIEIISGVAPGEKYVAQNSFVLKAQLAKASIKGDND